IGASATSTMADISLTPLFDVNDRNVSFNTNFSVNVTVNATVDGSLTAIVDNNTISLVGGNTKIKARATLSTPSGTSFQEYFASAGASDPGVSSDAVILDGLLRPSVTIDWRQPFSVIFNLQAEASAASGGVSFVTTTFDSLNSLSFSKDGPAFLVPEGFTVNAPELNIFDNQWIDPRASVVPLPASLPLLLSGIVALSFLRKRNKS
ncbi:MAG: VPLPA-CTERM sorting domain-containing protein, partial [Gammaproteobacteria bacterium]